MEAEEAALRYNAQIKKLTAENEQLRRKETRALLNFQRQVALEEQYRESQTRFKTIFKRSTMGNKIIGPDLRILEFNEVFRKMLGYAEEDLLGARITDFSHPDFTENWLKLQQNLWSHKLPSFQIETCLIRKDRSVFWCLVTSILIDDHGKQLGYSIIQDINARKELEIKLNDLYESQETLVHMVAHDIKNPVYNIKILADELIQSLTNPQLSPEAALKEQHHLLHLIHNTCDKTFSILEDILHLGEMKVKIPFEIFDFEIFIGNQLILLGQEARKKGIRIIFKHPEEPVFVRLNQEKFARLFENLISNGIKFTHPGGQIEVEIKKENQEVILRISDTGIGIPDSLRGAIFQKFSEASRPGTGGEKSTGLGLYIVKQMVDLHQAQVRVESEENKGTTFFIHLKRY